MKAEHWKRVNTLLAELIGVPEDERAALLDRLCAGDDGLRAELLGLLAHEHALPDAVPSHLVDVWARDQDGDQWIGRRIGAFVLEERLGSGGSSVVFRARRDGDFAQLVAIKLLRTAAGDAVVARFLREREILAALHHPNIAQLYDAGSSTDGTPYLVLEYIDGLSWDAWLRERRPQLTHLLQHFLRVCDAVLHAHQRLFVHRDIKPSNLVVDASDCPKLLDFGIAKLLADSQGDELTRELGNSYTPAYAAPEQIAGTAVTTATDVHALGVLLYESLSGTHPYRKPGDSEQQVIRAVMELEPGKPSEAAATSMLAQAAAGLRSDLDNIVLTAIEKDPARRYAGVGAFAADIRSAMAGHPIAARPHTWRYLTGKFVHRHRLPVAAGALALLAVLAASAVALWQGAIAVRERAASERRFEQVRQFTHAILFDYHEGIQKLAGSLPMQKRLVEDSLKYLEALQKEAGGDANLWEEIAEAWIKTGNLQGNPYVSNLGDFSGAARSYAQAAAAITHVPKESAAHDFLLARVYAYQAHLKHQDGVLDKAQKAYEQSIAIYEAMPQPLRSATDVRLEHADTLEIFGDLLGREGQISMMQIERARTTYLQAAQLRMDTLAADPANPRVRYAVYKSRLREGEYWAGQGDMQRAERELLDTLGLIEALHGQSPDDAYLRREVALVHTRLVSVQDALDKIPESIDHALQATRMMETMLAADPENDTVRQGLTAACGWAARQLIRAQRYAQAGPIIERQIAVNQMRLDAAPGNADIEFSLSLAYRRLGEQLSGLGRHEEAITTHERALALQEKVRALGAEYELSHALSRLHIGRNQVALARLGAARASLDGAATQVAALLRKFPEADRFRSIEAEMLEAAGDAWTADAGGNGAAAERYRQALATWQGYEHDYPLAPAEIRQRDALVAKIAALD